ncbi:NAD-dependent epimerase/dehydratase family protein [Mitsuokella jalaludinii]|uniref:NAD-dependent epimerase/dehydratase family protein n=1 Tax=Mitsuokella jalaludinii TaxID=187979 RepID=UPI003F8A45AE
MNILVTGGAGFIGSHLVRYLLQEGEAVTVLDNLSTGLRSHLPKDGFTFWNMDIRDVSVREKIKEAHFDAVVHLAAQTMVDASIRNPYFDADENVLGTVNLLEAIRFAGISRIVFASTAAVYGNVAENHLPITEDFSLQPMSFYGLTKLIVERYLSLYHHLYGLNYVILRFANAYGERQGDKGEGGVISIFAKRATSGQTLNIFGDGTQTRDFIYAGDIARAIYKALKTNAVNTTYNISTNIEISLNDLISVLTSIKQINVQVAYKDARAGDIPRSVLSNKKAREKIGWSPKIYFENGLQRTIQYFMEGSALKE